MKKRIVLLGGDLRQYYMAKSLIRKDFAISYYGLNFPQEEQGAHQCRDKGALWSALREADALVLPDPVSRDGITVRENMLETPVLLAEVTLHMDGQQLFGGRFPIDMVAAAAKNNCRLHDFVQNERLQIKNATLIAEAALLEAKLLSDEMLQGSNCLLIGYTLEARLLVQYLKAFGAHVTVASTIGRRRLEAEACGCVGMDEVQLSESGIKWNYVFQITGDMKLGRKLLNLMQPDTVILDLTEKEDSVNTVYGRSQHLTIRKCTDLPGRYAAKTVGEEYADYVAAVI